MTLEAFISDVLGPEAQNYTHEEIESLYNASVKLFNILFDKWKKEKITIAKCDNSLSEDAKI